MPAIFGFGAVIGSPCSSASACSQAYIPALSEFNSVPSMSQSSSFIVPVPGRAR